MPRLVDYDATGLVETIAAAHAQSYLAKTRTLLGTSYQPKLNGGPSNEIKFGSSHAGLVFVLSCPRSSIPTDVNSSAPSRNNYSLGSFKGHECI